MSLNNELEKTVYISNLYDTYKNMLTLKQQEHFEMYYFEDYSLSEIASQLNISKFAVYDSLLKVVKKLEELEKKLQFNSKINEIKEFLDNNDIIGLKNRIRDL